MKKNYFFLILFILVFFNIHSISQAKERITPPVLTDKTDLFEIEPTIIEDYDYYLSDLYDDLDKNPDSWSTVSKTNLKDISFMYQASSTLKNYPPKNTFDNSFKTAWVEGKKDNGIGEWIRIEIHPRKSNKKPFIINEIAIIPGYLKSYRTWTENNRIRVMTVIIQTPNQSNSPLTVFKLKFHESKDSVGGIQVFRMPDSISQEAQSLDGKVLWLIIDDVNKGISYSDTCISEIIISQTNSYKYN
jgi:hypothetical protein